MAKAMTKEHLLEAINTVYKTGDVIYSDDIIRQFERLGDEYFYDRETGKMELTRRANVNWSDDKTIK